MEYLKLAGVVILGLALLAIVVASGLWPVVALLLFGGFLAWLAVRGPFRF